MTLLDTHLEQISLCAQTIAELPFPPPKIFTNALIQPHDITTLIRDTEPHERALFSVQGSSAPANAQDARASRSRRATAFDVNAHEGSIGNSQYGVRVPKSNAAIASLLGGNLAERIRQGAGANVGGRYGHGSVHERAKGEVDVDMLLNGAEKLCGIYPLPGAVDRVTALRDRYKQVKASIEQYEVKVAQQTAELNKMNPSTEVDRNIEENPNAEELQRGAGHEYVVTKDDLRKEEEGLRELERKKQALESRVSVMERDLGGLLR